MFWLKPPGRRFLFYSLAILGLAGFLALAPPVFIERMKTIVSLAETPQTEQVEEGSANTRLVLLSAQWEMFKDHPFGAGHRGTTVLSPDYLDESFLTVDRAKGVEARASHNTLMTTLVDQGFVGFGLYIWLILWIAFTLRKLKRMDRQDLPADLAVFRMGLGGSLAVILVAGLFSNYFKAEIMVWCLALFARLQVLAIAATSSVSGTSQTTPQATPVRLPASPASPASAGIRGNTKTPAARGRAPGSARAPG